MIKDMTKVLIIGTGTIGQPLLRALLKFQKRLRIKEIIFLKNTPKTEDVGMVLYFQSLNAKLCVYESRKNGFKKLGLCPDYTFEEALDQATVVIDCTDKDKNGKPVALNLKEKYYKNYLNNCAGFIAQGGAKGFGKPFAYGINNQTLRIEKPEDKYVQVVSCNTHNILAILQTLVLAYEGPDNLESARFYLERRVSDISQKKGILGVEVGTPTDSIYGSHQAADAMRVLKTIGIEQLNIHSRANKSPNSYMHTINFNLRLKKPITQNEIFKRFKQNPLIATTYLMTNNEVFSAGRDRGHYGRILNQTVVCLPSLEIINKTEVEGTCFTPQDGNSLLSSLAALLFFLDKTEKKTGWEKQVKEYFYHPPFLFKEI